MAKVIEYDFLYENEWVTIIDYFGGKLDDAKTLEELINLRKLNKTNMKNLKVVAEY